MHIFSIWSESFFKCHDILIQNRNKNTKQKQFIKNNEFSGTGIKTPLFTVTSLSNKQGEFHKTWRRRRDSNSRASCPANAFRVRPVMTTSIRLQVRIIVNDSSVLFNQMRISNCAEPDILPKAFCCLGTIKIFNKCKAKINRCSHSLARDYVAIYKHFLIFNYISTASS